MKRIPLLIALLFSCILGSAQSVEFLISDGMNDGPMKRKIESNISAFLRACNSAYPKGTLDLSQVSISEDAAGSFSILWANMPFHCVEEQVVERILTYYAGYKVRRVPIETKDEKGRPDYQELVIEMDGEGVITRVNLAIENHLYQKLFEGGKEVRDLRHRQMILDYVEQFRTAYNKKDIDFLENVFSDDALIITGKVIKRKKGDRTAVLKDDIVYTEYSKRAYLDRLKNRIFPATSYIRVNFSDIKIAKHPSIDGYYGVTLRQGYESSIYSDEGYLFMLWDFRDENQPQIHVRTWQPYWMDEDKTKRLDESKVFGINDFKVK